MTHFGNFIAERRKQLELSLSKMAEMIKKEDGSTITPQYLNDIERNRRNPPSEGMIRQISNALGVSADYLLFLAGKAPGDISKNHSPEDIEEAYTAFRKTLEDKK